MWTCFQTKISNQIDSSNKCWLARAPGGRQMLPESRRGWQVTIIQGTLPPSSPAKSAERQCPLLASGRTPVPLFLQAPTRAV
jgi:hypothetical protein